MSLIFPSPLGQVNCPFPARIGQPGIGAHQIGVTDLFDFAAIRHRHEAQVHADEGVADDN